MDHAPRPPARPQAVVSPATGGALLALGAAFFAPGVAGQAAFLGVAPAFLAVGGILLARSRRRSGTDA